MAAFNSCAGRLDGVWSGALARLRKQTCAKFIACGDGRRADRRGRAADAPGSCLRAASLRLALAYRGISTTDADILDIIGSDLRPAVVSSDGSMRWGNPYVTFVGNVQGSEVALTGYGTYYPPIAKAATALGGKVLKAGEGIAPSEVYQAVRDGHPVVVWATYHWVVAPRRDYVSFDEQTIPYAGPIEHAVTVTGVVGDEIYINNE